MVRTMGIFTLKFMTIIGSDDMKTYKDIVKTQTQLEIEGFHVENNMVTSVDLNVIAHFGNITCLEMFFTNCALFSDRNIGGLLPDVLKAIIEVLEIENEDGLRISKIKNIPCRIVTTGEGFGKVVGFGHFMKQRFVLADDLIEIARENMEERYAKGVK